MCEKPSHQFDLCSGLWVVNICSEHSHDSEPEDSHKRFRFFNQSLTQMLSKCCFSRQNYLEFQEKKTLKVIKRLNANLVWFSCFESRLKDLKSIKMDRYLKILGTPGSQKFETSKRFCKRKDLGLRVSTNL